MLSTNWLIEDPIDFEYKKYILLAYEKKERGRLRDRLLYPAFTDLIHNKNYLDVFINNSLTIENGKKEIIGIDINEQKLIYRSLIDDGSLDTIKEIAVFGKEIIDDLYKEYSSLYDEINDSIIIDGNIISTFSIYSGYIVIDNIKNKMYYEYSIEKKISNDILYLLELNKIQEHVFFKKRYEKNYFNIQIPTKDNFDNTVIPVLKRKFLKKIVSNYS